MVFKNRKSLWKAERSVTRVYQWHFFFLNSPTYNVSIQFLSIFIFSQVWTLWHSSSKSREFAAIGKCIRSENPAQEKGTLLVYWSVPYKILTECTLIIDIKGASIHTYICLTRKEKKHGADWRNDSSLSNPPCPSHLRKIKQGTVICSNAFN